LLWESATNIRIEITSADIGTVLRRLTDYGIMLHNIQKEGELKAVIFVGNKDYLYTLTVLDRLHAEYVVPDKKCSTASLKGIRARFVLLFSVALLILVSLYLPGRILFVTVIGNEQVPARRIAEAASKSGVCCGAVAADVRSEKVKNAILQELPQLQWVGVNTSGCVAEIYVEEKSSSADTGNQKYSVSSLVAVCDGIVESCTVTRGTILCNVGKAVLEGEVLISGYTDCGIFLRATMADGEVYAQTIRPISAICPTTTTKKGIESGKELRYGLRFGKNLINFNNSSGICDGTCAKIYEEQYMVLPGGFVLPVSLTKETIVYYDSGVGLSENLNIESVLRQGSQAYIHSQMVAGEILNDSAIFTQSDGCAQLNGYYICSELISRQKTENILQGEK